MFQSNVLPLYRYEPEKTYKLVQKSIPYHVNFIIIIISKKFYFVSNKTVCNKLSICTFYPFTKSVTFCKTLVTITFFAFLWWSLASERDFLTLRYTVYHIQTEISITLNAILGNQRHILHQRNPYILRPFLYSPWNPFQTQLHPWNLISVVLNSLSLWLTIKSRLPNFNDYK